MKRFIGLLAVFSLVLGMALPALADASITVVGQPMSVEAQDILFEEVTLDGTYHPDVPGATEEWIVKDPSGTGSGYNVFISATDFIHQGGKLDKIDADNDGDTEEPALIDNAGFGMTLSNEAIIAKDITNGVAPVSEFEEEAILDDDPQSFMVAAEDEGQGTWGVTPTFSLDVAAESYAGEYLSTVEVTIVAAGEGGEG